MKIMGEKSVSDKASLKVIRYTGTYDGDSVSTVFVVPDTNLNIGSWSLGGFPIQLGS